ncbi:hypothetical protein [Peribacillus muralis]|uniref:hypothetical protein n=1 Tax=Peribacillus muralis TaxID=264697 RepID=UPI00366D50BF
MENVEKLALELKNKAEKLKSTIHASALEFSLQETGIGFLLLYGKGRWPSFIFS